MLDALLHAHWIGASGDILHADLHHCLCEHSRGGGSVTCDVIGLGRNFLHELGAHVLELVFEFDFFCDRDTVVGDRWSTKLLVEHDVAALRPEGHFDRIGELVDTSLKGLTGVVIKLQNFCHVVTSLLHNCKYVAARKNEQIITIDGDFSSAVL